MVALEIETAVGHTKRMVIRQYSDAHHRQNPQKAADEYRLLQITQAQGLATQVPYFCDQTGQIFSKPYLLLEYIEGEMMFSPPDLVSTVRQLAAQMAQIHQVDPARVDLSFLPTRGDVCPELGKERPYEPDSSSLEGRIAELLVAAIPLTQANKPALLHGDFWPGNSLWRDGKLVAVIDWEDAMLGDPLIDLAQSRAEIAWIFGFTAMEIFTRTYQSLTDLDYRDLPYWDLCAVLRVLRIAGGDLDALAFYFASYGRADITAESIEENLLLLIN
jgi:aminoglycoside phosphotransferase (APT) family kinase protein